MKAIETADTDSLPANVEFMTPVLKKTETESKNAMKKYNSVINEKPQSRIDKEPASLSVHMKTLLIKKPDLAEKSKTNVENLNFEKDFLEFNEKDNDENAYPEKSLKYGKPEPLNTNQLSGTIFGKNWSIDSLEMLGMERESDEDVWPIFSDEKGIQQDNEKSLDEEDENKDNGFKQSDNFQYKPLEDEINTNDTKANKPAQFFKSDDFLSY